MIDASPRSYAYASTPLGQVLVITAGDTLAGLYFAGHTRTPPIGAGARAEGDPPLTVRKQLDEYFQGTRIRFDLPLLLDGTPFQVAVWSALIEIPYGRTTTYAALAATIGRPRAARAVGAANGRNPISIVVPCHRLIGTNGNLTGYGWGLERKQRLLQLEGAQTRGAGRGAAGVRRERAGS